MTNVRRLLLCLFGVALGPSALWAATPWHGAAHSAHEGLLGCRWRRCARVVAVMPRTDEPVSLRANFDKGPAYYPEQTTETVQLMTVMGQEVKQTQSQTYVMEWTPLGKNPQGDWLLRQKFIGIKMNVDIGGVRIDYCSWGDARPAPSPLADFFKRLPGSELELVIDATSGRVKKVVGHEELVNKLRSTTSPQMEPLFVKILTQDVVAQMAEPHFAFVPRQPVRRGDTWLQSSDLGLGSIGSFRMESKLTYDGRAAGLHRILIDHNMKYLPAKGDASLPFTIKSADYKSSSGKGEMLFDAARGRLVSSTANTTLDGTITIEVGGMETKVGLHQTQSMRIRVTDANPLLQRQQ